MALRQMLMLSQASAAELVGVKDLSYRRWESPEYDHMPPDDVIAQLERLVDMKDERVAALLEIADAQPDIPVLLPLYRDKMHYMQEGRDTADMWQVVNAISITVGEQLRAEGREVEFTYDYAKTMSEMTTAK